MSKEVESLKETVSELKGQCADLNETANGLWDRLLIVEAEIRQLKKPKKLTLERTISKEGNREIWREFPNDEYSQHIYVNKANQIVFCWNNLERAYSFSDWILSTKLQDVPTESKT